LSGAGKTTIAFALEEYLIASGVFCYGLDGDNVRGGLCSDLGFSEGDRDENIRRVAEVAKLFADAGAVAICSFVSPFRQHREFGRRLHQSSALTFFEVFVDTPLNECERRDTKGLYAKARAGQLRGFTGIDQPYERPEKPDLVVETTALAVDGDQGLPLKSVPVRECVQRVLDLLAKADIITTTVAAGADAFFRQREDGRPTGSLSTTAPNNVRELFVEDHRLQDVLQEAQTLEALELSTIDLQWLQVLHHHDEYIYFLRVSPSFMA
jgi:3'-phosphoadenosine 5'-phosphosulfate synthase